MSPIEWLTAIAFAAIWLGVRWRARVAGESPALDPFARCAGGVAVVFAAVLLSLHEATQFFTLDEKSIALGVAQDDDFLLSQWMQSALHTSAALLLPIAKLAHHVGLDASTVVSALKALHWAMGATLLAWIAQQCARPLRPAVHAALAEPLLLAVLLMLPIDAIALRVFNYDAIALFGGVLAVLLVARAWRESDERCAQFAVLVGSLAACEKLSASPVLLVVIVASALLRARLHAARPLRAALAGVARALALSLAVSLSLSALYAVTTHAALPADFWWTTLGPLGSWLSLPLLFLAGSGIGSAASGHRMLGLLTLPVLAATTFALLASGRSAWARERVTRLQRAPLGAVLLALLVVGAVGAFIVHAYWAPMVPSAIPRLQRAFALNGVVLHFGAGNLPLHYLDYVIYCATLLVCATPSVLWLGAVVGRARGDNGADVPGLDALIVLGLLLAFVAVISGVPIGQKYLGVLILPVGLWLALRLVRRFVAEPASGRALGAVALLAFALEILPFGPLYASFRPFWLEYRDITPQPGTLNPSWLGWGEELMQAGKELEARCLAQPLQRLADVPCGRLRLHARYPGLWLHNSPLLADAQFGFPAPTLSTSADYYVLNRSTVVQNFVPFPAIQPEFVITARGYPMAWVYRGDRLAQSKAPAVAPVAAKPTGDRIFAEDGSANAAGE